MGMTAATGNTCQVPKELLGYTPKTGDILIEEAFRGKHTTLPNCLVDDIQGTKKEMEAAVTSKDQGKIGMKIGGGKSVLDGRESPRERGSSVCQCSQGF